MKNIRNQTWNNEIVHKNNIKKTQNSKVWRKIKLKQLEFKKESQLSPWEASNCNILPISIKDKCFRASNSRAKIEDKTKEEDLKMINFHPKKLVDRERGKLCLNFIHYKFLNLGAIENF